MSSKSVPQESLTRVSSKKCQLRVSYKSVKLSKSVVQECQVRVSEKSVSQARMSHKIVKSECPRRGSSKKCQVRSVPQEC